MRKVGQQVMLDPRIDRCLDGYQRSYIEKQAGRNRTILINYINIYVRFEDGYTESDIKSQLSEVFAQGARGAKPVANIEALDSGDRREVEIKDLVTLELSPESLGVDEPVSNGATGGIESSELNAVSDSGGDSSDASLTRKQKEYQKKRARKRAKEKEVKELAVKLGDLAPKTELERQFYYAIKGCFDLPGGNVIIGNRYSELPYEFRLKVFKVLKLEAGQVSLLPERIGVIFTLLLPEMILPMPEASQDRGQFSNYVYRINDEMVVLIKSLIGQGLVRPSNLRDWVFHAQLLDNELVLVHDPIDKLIIWVNLLFECGKLTAENYHEWSRVNVCSSGLSINTSIALIDKIVIIGVSMGNINQGNIESWYKAVRNKDFKEYHFCASVASALALSSNTLLSDIGEWYEALYSALKLNKEIVSNIIISKHLGVAMKDDKVFTVDKGGMIVVIALSCDIDPDLTKAMFDVVDGNPEIESLIVNYLYDQQANISNASSVLLASKDKVLKAYSDLISLKSLFQQAEITDKDVARLSDDITPMDNMAKQCLVNYVDRNSLIKKYLKKHKGKEIQSDIRNINILLQCFSNINREVVFAQLFHLLSERNLLDQWPDYYHGGISENKEFLYSIAKEGVASGATNLTNFHDWFAKVKTLDLAFEEYATLYNYVIAGIVDKKDLDVKDLRSWYDQLQLEFCSMPLIKGRLNEIEHDGLVELFPKSLNIEGDDIANLLWYHRHKSEIFFCDIVALSSRGYELYNIVEEETFFDLVRFLIGEDNVKLNDLPTRLRNLINYSIEASKAEYTLEERQRPAPKSIYAFLEGKKANLDIPGDIRDIAHISAETFKIIVSNQLEKLEGSCKSKSKNDAHIKRTFFELFSRSSLMMQVMGMHHHNSQSLCCVMNNMFMDFAIKHNILVANAKSIKSMCQEAGFSYNDLLDSTFAYFTNRADVSVAELLNWIDAFQSFLPEQWAQSQHRSLEGDLCDFADNRTYILARCLIAFSYIEDDLSEKRAKAEAKYISSGDMGEKQLQMMMLIQAMDEDQIDYLLAPDLEKHIMESLVCIIEADNSLTKVGMREKIMEQLSFVPRSHGIASSLSAADQSAEGRDISQALPASNSKRRKRRKPGKSAKADLLGAMEKCFNAEFDQVEIDGCFDNLSLKDKLEIFDLVKADFDDLDVRLSNLSNLHKRIKMLYQLLGAASLGNGNLNDVEDSDPALNIQARITLLICCAIEQGGINSDNIKDWLNEIGSVLTDQQYKIIAGHLLKCEQVTPGNITAWRKGILKSQDKNNHRLLGDFVQVGVSSNVINLESFDSWYDALKLVGYKPIATLVNIVSELQLLEDLPLCELINWGNKFAQKGEIPPYSISQLILKCYAPNPINDYPLNLSLKEVVTMLALYQVQATDYFPEIIRITQDESNQSGVREVMFRYLVDHNISRKNIVEQCVYLPKVLSSAKEALDYIDVTLGEAGEGKISGGETVLVGMLSGMDSGAKDIVLNHLFSKYVITKTGGARVTYRNINYFTKLLQNLIAGCKNQGESNFAVYKEMLCKIAYDAIGNNIMTLANAPEWLNLVRENDLDFEFYAELYYNIAYGLVGNSSNIEVTDLKPWQELLMQKFYSIRSIRDQLQQHAPQNNRQSGQGEGMVKKKKFLASGLSCCNSFTQSVTGMVCQKSGLETGEGDRQLAGVMKFIVREPNLKLSLLPIRLGQINQYLRTDTAGAGQREPSRSEEASNKISEFLQGTIRLSIPKDLDLIKAIDIESLRRIILRQLDGFDAFADKSESFFQLLLRQRFLFEAFALCKVNVAEFKLEINSLMIRYAYEEKIIEANKESIIHACEAGQISYDNLLDNFFAFSFTEKNFPLQNIIKWFGLFDEVVPVEYAISQISVIKSGESDKDLFNYYLLNSCLKAMYSVNETEVSKKISAYTFDQFKAVLMTFYINAEQIEFFLEASEELSTALVSKVWENQDLTKENMSDKYASAVVSLVGQKQGIILG